MRPSVTDDYGKENYYSYPQESSSGCGGCLTYIVLIILIIYGSILFRDVRALKKQLPCECVQSETISH